MTNEPQLLRSSGDLRVGLATPPRQRDRLTAMLRLTAVGGQPFQIELTRDDVVHLASDLGVMLADDANRICSWWYRLRHGDRAGLLPTGGL